MLIVFLLCSRPVSCMLSKSTSPDGRHHMRNRIIAALSAVGVGILLTFAAPHAALATTHSQTCDEPTKVMTSDTPQAETARGRLNKACFVQFTDTCDGTTVTLLNPSEKLEIIRYRVGDEDTTHTVAFGETELVQVDGENSPFWVYVVVGEKVYKFVGHKWVEPDVCATPSPSPSPSPVASPSPSPVASPSPVVVVVGGSGGDGLQVTGGSHTLPIVGAVTLFAAGVALVAFVAIRRRRATN